MALPSLRRNRGVSLIEFVLVFPLFLMLLAAVIDFGILMFDQHTLQFATREGARLGLVGRTLPGAGGAPLSREDSIIKAIKDNVAVAVNPSKVQINFYPVNDDYTDPTGWQGMQDAGAPGKYMRVKTRFEFNVPVVSVFIPTAKFTIQAQSTYRNEFFGG